VFLSNRPRVKYKKYFLFYLGGWGGELRGMVMIAQAKRPGRLNYL